MLRELPSYHDTPAGMFRSDSISLAFGGIPETVRFRIPERPDAGGNHGWLVCGIGLAQSGSGCRFLDAGDWDAAFRAPTPDLSRFEGHFIALRWSGADVECYCDAIGFRTLYAARRGDAVLFSTRPDWLAQACGGGEIDLDQLGSHWLLANQLAATSMVRGIARLGPGGRGRLAPGTIEFRETLWTPPDESRNPEEPAAPLRRYLQPDLGDGSRLALGLSGGMDSRLVLALMLEEKIPFLTYVIGEMENPDVRLATLIAAREGLEQLHIDAPLPGPEAMIESLGEYAGETSAIEPASSSLKLRYYPELHARHLTLIDGGLGEIGRRQFLKRLVTAGKGALRSGRPEEIFPYLAAHRAGVMEPGAAAAMRQGALADIERFWERMPPVAEIGEERFADLLTVRARFPNYAGREQSRSDSYIVSYMPFAQPSVISRLSGLPLRQRDNACFFKRTIREARPSLAKIPLVKGSAAYPFALPTIAAWGYQKVLGKLGMTYSNPAPGALLMLLREYILDLIASRDVKEYAPYDYPRLRRMAESYYAGDRTHESELDWWLSFESWRRGMG